MPVAGGTDVFTAFERLLHTLCLDEFPCGSGSWRSSEGHDEPSSRFLTTTKNYGADKEQVEVLEEFVTSTYSPYSVDYSWSKEAKELRETAVKSPWKISREFILAQFESLRIVDQNVNRIDVSMLQFPSLRELTLSANVLSTVDGRCLPRSLKVLELVANQISDLESICNQPPEVQHLGLGLNKISAVHDYLTGEYWPCLLSLDLTYNNLTDLKDLVDKLQTLPKLRNLALLGNPLAFIPGYRGFIIDSLRSLTILDDIQVSADEKHHFKGLARRRDCVQDEAEVVINILTVTGIPKPPELDITEELPPYPIITRSFYVEVMFLEDFASNLKHDDVELESRKDEGKEQEDYRTKVNKDGQGVQRRTVHITKQDTTEIEVQDTGEESQKPFTLLLEDDESGETGIMPLRELNLRPYRTQSLQWSEESMGTMEMAFKQTLTIDDLPALKQCFKQGLQLTVKEDKVLSHLPEEMDDAQSQASQRKGSRKGEKKEEKKEKPKDIKSAKGGKKKKKEPELELIHSPPEVTVLGTYTLPLDNFISGEHIAQSICKCLVNEQELTHDEPDKTDDKKDKRKKGVSDTESIKSKKGKDGKEKGKKTGKADRPDSKAKLSPPKSSAEEDEEDPPPPPLTVSVKVELVKWTTAQDSMPKVETNVELVS